MIVLDDENFNSVTRQLLCNSLILLFIYTVMSVSASNTHTKRYRQATYMCSLQIHQIFNASVKKGDNLKSCEIKRWKSFELWWWWGSE